MLYLPLQQQYHQELDALVEKISILRYTKKCTCCECRYPHVYYTKRYGFFCVSCLQKVLNCGGDVEQTISFRRIHFIKNQIKKERLAFRYADFKNAKGAYGPAFGPRDQIKMSRMFRRYARRDCELPIKTRVQKKNTGEWLWPLAIPDDTSR